MPTRRLLHKAALATLASSVVPLTPLFAQGMPALPGTIKIIVVVPAGASMDNIARLVADRLKDSLKRNVVVPVGGTPAEFRQLILSERARWGPVAKAANIKVDS